MVAYFHGGRVTFGVMMCRAIVMTCVDAGSYERIAEASTIATHSNAIVTDVILD